MKLVTNPDRVYRQETSLLQQLAHERGLFVVKRRESYYGSTQITSKAPPLFGIFPRKITLADCRASGSGNLNYFILHTIRQPEKREEVLNLLRRFEEECRHDVSVEE